MFVFVIHTPTIAEVGPWYVASGTCSSIQVITELVHCLCRDGADMQYTHVILEYTDTCNEQYTCTYIVVYASHAHFKDLWTNTCGLVSRRGTCFWDCRSTHVQQSVKSVRMTKRTYTIYGTTLKEFRGCERSFAPHRMRGNGSFSRQPGTLFITLGAAALSRTHRSRHGLHGVVVAFTLSVFSSVFVPGS